MPRRIVLGTLLIVFALLGGISVAAAQGLAHTPTLLARLAYQKDGDIFTLAIYDDGYLQTMNLTNNVGGRKSFGPAWSPNGAEIAYNTDCQIHLIRLDGSGDRNLSIGSFCDINPTWSPDGTQIAFFQPLSMHGLKTLWVMSADGTNRRYIADKAEVSPISWMDNDTIRYVSRAKNPNGTMVVVVSNPNEYESSAVGPALPQELDAYQLPAWAFDTRTRMNELDDTLQFRAVTQIGPVDARVNASGFEWFIFLFGPNLPRPTYIQGAYGGVWQPVVNQAVG